jgi:hypothetical protein
MLLTVVIKRHETCDWQSVNSESDPHEYRIRTDESEARFPGAGAQPVDWLPRLASDYLLPDERDLDTEDAGDEAEGDCEGSERRNGLWFQRAVLEAVYVRAQRVVRRVQHLWERAEPRTQAMAANKVSVTVRLYSVVHKLATSEKGVLNLLGCVGGEDDGEDSDQDSEPDLVWESEESETSESSEDEAEEERKVFQGEAMVLDKRVVLEAVRKLREVAEEAEVEYRPEVDSLLRQCRRLERLMALVSEDEATEASHHVFRGLLATLEDARKRIQPHCGLLFCAPVRDNSMRKVTEAAANISELVEEGGEAVLADLGRCNMSAPLVSNHDAWTCWRRGPGGAQAVAMPGVELARAISKTVQAMVRRTMVPGAQDDEEEDARNRRRHLPAAVATSAVAALAEVSVCGELSDAVSLLAMACMFPGRVSLLLSLEALLYSNQVREELALKRAREAGNFTRLSAAAAQPGDAPAEHAARELWRVGQKVVKELVYRARREEAAVGALLDAALMEVDVRALDTTPAPAPLPRARSEGNFSLILNQYAKQMRAALAARVAELHPPASALCITDQSNPGANQTSGVDELLLRSAEGGAAAACLHTTLHCGASLDARDARGNTPLHLAAGQGHVEVVRLLAYLGADTCANNLAGQTPDELAEKRGHRRAAQLLAELAAGSLVTGPATSQERLVEQASLLRIRDAARPLRPKRAANFTSDAPDPKTTRGSLGGGEAGVGVNAMGRIVLPSLWREARAHLRSPPTSPRSSPRRSASSPSRRRQATTLQPTKDQHHIAGLPFTTMAAAGILQDFGADGSASVWRTGANGQAEKNDSKDLGDGKDEDEDEDESESVTTTSSSSESDRWPAAAFQRRSQRHRRESYVRHETSRTLDMLPRQAPLRVPPDAEPAASCSSPLSPGKARLRRAPSQVILSPHATK